MRVALEVASPVTPIELPRLEQHPRPLVLDLPRKPKQHVDGGSHLASRDLSKTALAALAFAKLEQRIDRLASRRGVEVETLGEIDGARIRAVRIPARKEAKLSVLITGGVHGKEASGTEAAIRYAEAMIAGSPLRDYVSVTVIPCLNPYGYARVLRENGDGKDLNRWMGHGKNAPLEAQLFEAFARKSKYDLAIDLHSAASAGDRGFFAIHDGGREVLDTAVAEFAKTHPVMSESTDRYTMDAPGIFGSSNQGTLKALMKQLGTPWSFTVEAAGKMPFEAQAAGLFDFVGCIVRAGANEQLRRAQ